LPARAGRRSRSADEAGERADRAAIVGAGLVEVLARTGSRCDLVARPLYEAEVEAAERVGVPGSGVGEIGARLPVLARPEDDATCLERIGTVGPRLDGSEVEQLRDRPRRGSEPSAGHPRGNVESVAVQDMCLDPEDLTVRAGDQVLAQPNEAVGVVE